MAADIVDLGFRVDTSEIDQALKKFGLIDQAFKKAEKSGGLVFRSFESVGEAGKKSGGLVSRAFADTSAEIDRTTKSGAGLTSMLGGLGALVGSIGLVQLATDALNTYRSFESMQATLKTMTGSTEAASKAFGELQKFAATTPYELSQAVEGFNKLKALGLDPSVEALKSYGNTASAMGKDLMQMIEAVADASTGEFERLKEFGIKSAKEGDKVTFTFQGIKTTVANTSEAIQKYLMDIGNNQFGTAMADQAETLNGKISNLKDGWSALQVTLVQQTGAADLAKAAIGGLADVLSGATTWIATASQNGGIWNGILLAMGDAGQTVSASITSVGNAFAWIGDAIAPALPYLTDFGVAIAAILASLGGASLIISGVTGAFGLLATAVSAAGAAVLANPIVATVAAIGAAAYVIYDNWDSIGSWWEGIWGDMQATANQFIGWWSSTTFDQKIIDVATFELETAQGVATDFINWWNQSVLKQIYTDVETSALDYAKQKGDEFGAWWDSWTLKQVVADVSAEVLIFAWDKSRQFASWWDSWNLKEIALTASSAILEKAFGVAKTLGGWWDEWKLLTKDLKADASLVEKAEAIARKFADWWNNLSLKSIIPDIKMPDIAGFGAKLGAKMRSIGSDVIDGLAQGMDRASSHVKAAEQAANKIPLVLRSALDTHSPSKVTEKIGFDVVAGLAVGIAGNNGAVNAAANLSLAVTNEFSRMADDINRSLTDAFMSLDVGKIGSSLVGMFKQHVVQPILSNVLKPLSDELASAFSGIAKTLSGSIGSMFGGLGGMFGGGLGSLLGGGLIAGIGSLLKGLFKKDGNLVFSQGMQAGQQLTGQGGHNGQEHYRQTALGLIGATSESNKIGREQGFVPEFHKMMDAMVQLDDMIAKTIPNSVGKIKDALAGLEVKGFSTAEMLKQRYATVLQSLPDELQKAMANGRDVMSMTGEEIVTRFQLLAQVAESGLIPSLQSLGLNLGATHESALAAGLGLVDLMGGIDKVKAATDFYYQNFFTDKQREAATLKAAKTDVDAFNKSLGLTGSAAIDTHAEFRKYVQSLDLTTEAGRKAYAEAMKYAQSIDAVADANKAATQAQNELIASLRGSLQGIRDSFKDSITRINEDLMSQEELQKKYMNEAQKWAEKLKTESDPAKIADISAKLNEAVGKVWGTMTDEQKAANADYLKNLLTAAQADAERGLKNAISQAQQMREAISTLQRPANEMSNAASKMMSAAAKMPTDINITVTSEGVDVDKLPKFAKGGITSGVSIAGEAGAEAVVPLPDGRSIPVSMKINNAATLSTAADTATKAATTTTTATTTKISDEALKAYKDAIKSAQDYAYELKYGSDALRERKLLEEGWTQQMVDNLRTIEKSNDAAKKAAEIKSSYESAMKAANDQLFALKNGEEALRRRTLLEQGWTEQMINNLLKIEDANKAAEKSKQIAEDYKAALKSAEDYAYQLQFGEEALRRRTLLEQGWTEQMINNLLKIEDANKAAEKSKQIAEDYKAALKSAEDYAYQLQFGEEALRRRTLLEQGWTEQMINNLLKIEDANKAAEKAAQIKNDYDAAMKAAQDYAYELKYGSEALKRRTLLEQGWTEQMINNLFALEKANEEARKAAEANQNAIDAMNKQRESEIETYERLQDAAKSMRQTLDELFYNAELTLASPFERLEAARKKVDDLSAKAAHDPVSAEALSAAVTDALKLSREYNASSQAYVDDYKRMTGLLAQVAEKIEKMRDPRNNGSSGPLRLSNGMEFVPGMRDDGTWEWDGSHAAGLSYVPFDGYIAQLHRGEMVVPANAANALRNLNNMDQQISMTPNVIDARPVFNNRHTERDDAQKQELAELKEQLKKANDKLERLASAVESGNAQKVQADKRKLALAEETRDSIHSSNRIADRKQVARGLK